MHQESQNPEENIYVILTFLDSLNVGIIWSFLLPVTLSSSPSPTETLILPSMPSSSFHDPLNLIMVACVGVELFTRVTSG